MNNQITLLKGSDRVRKRPAVVFGSDGIEGVMTAFQMLLDLFAEEAVKGYCDFITVTQYADGSVGLQDNGRGIYFGNDDTLWKSLFCELFPGSAYEIMPKRKIFDVLENGTVPGDNLELYATQCASAYMDIRVNRGGFQYSLHFEQGENKGGLEKTPCSAPSGTFIRFKPDPLVFSDTAIPAQQLAEKARTVAICIPGIKVVFRAEQDDGFTETEYCYPAGIADYLKGLTDSGESTPIYTVSLKARGQERYNKPRYTASVAVGLCFTKAPGFVECYHNLNTLSCGGIHREVLIQKLSKYLEWMLHCRISTDVLLAHLRLVVVTNSEITVWENGAQTSIANILIRDLTEDTIGEDYRNYVAENKALLSNLFCN